MQETNFLGKSGFIWWVGLVENRADPLGLGRCQVRLFGYHGDMSDKSKIDIPTDDLPWAHPMYPLNARNTFSAPALGDWVVGFFMDGESAQYPIMMGVLPGFNSTQSVT